jgi:hypothetical protein
MPTRILRLLQLVIIVGIVLFVVGGLTAKPDPTTNSVDPAITTKIAIILNVVAFVACALILLRAISRVQAIPGSERYIATAVLLALPFLAARLAYSALAVFLHNDTFSTMGGNIVVYVCMALVEEFVVAVLYIGAGFLAERGRSIVGRDIAQTAPMNVRGFIRHQKNRRAHRGL